MDFALESESDGKQARIDPARPLVLKVRRGDQPGGEIVVGLKNGKPYLDNCSSASCQVNDIDRAAALLVPGDILQLGALRFRLVALGSKSTDPNHLDVVEPEAQPRAANDDSDRQRRQRRISASRMTAVEPPQSSGLLRRVSAALGGRAEKQRLDELENERRQALIEAGRRSLGDGSALGLPGELLSTVTKGQVVSVGPDQMPGLARWREDRQRLVRLDAEIGALRMTLGLGADPDAVILTTPLKSDEKQKVDRAFATMDAVGTQELSGPPDNGRPVKRSPPRR